MEELKKGIYVDEDGQRTPLWQMADKIDLHRPFVDKIIFEKNGKTYHRTPEIIDVWFDSGSMPFAQFHYPFENKELFEKSFPADFIAEGIDQTRGWFYTLHNIATVLFNKPAFKNIIVNELILDKEGQKMSKSKGNVVYPLEMMNKYGADPLRWYFMAVSPPWIPKRFDENGLQEVIRKFFTTLINVYSFFVLYANVDKYEGEEPEIETVKRPEIDQWILSRLYSVAVEAKKFLDDYDITKATRVLSDFLIDDVSNWYVRRNRRRFWKSEVGSDKLAAYQTLHEIILIFVRLMAPMAPVISEEIFLNLKKATDPESVHLTSYPKLSGREMALQNTALEERMALAQKVVSIIRALRNDKQVRVRQPLSRLLVYIKSERQKADIQKMAAIICEEVNVKKIEFVTKEDELIIKSVKPNFRILGAKVGKLMGQLSGIIKGFAAEQIHEIESKGFTNVYIDGHELKLEAEDVEISARAKEELAIHSEPGLTIGLDLTLTAQLIEEGLAREFVNRIQNFRKEAGFEVTDHILIQLQGVSENLAQVIKNQNSYIRNETLADGISFEKVEYPFTKETTIENQSVQIGLKRTS